MISTHGSGVAGRSHGPVACPRRRKRRCLSASARRRRQIGQARRRTSGSLAEGTEEKIAWTQEEVVMLHGILFDTCVEQTQRSRNAAR